MAGYMSRLPRRIKKQEAPTSQTSVLFHYIDKYREMQGVGAMDKEQLSQLRYLKREIEMLKSQIEDLDYNMTTDSVKGSNPYFPYEERNFIIKGIGYKEYDNKLNRLQRKLNRRVEELMDLVEEMNEYIENIDDSLIRQIITLRYVNGLSWNQVAVSIGGNNTADSVRKVAERFLG